MNRDDAVSLSDNALKELKEALAHGKSDALLMYLNTMAKFHRYSFSNCVLIALQRPTATTVAGFHRWHDCGRWVKKGEKGIAIFAPIISKKKRQKGDEKEAHEEASGDRALVGFRVAYVYDISQTEGEELPSLGETKGDPGASFDRLLSLVKEKGITFSYADTLDGALGVSRGGSIELLATLSPAEKFSTLAHELAHELLHRGDRRENTDKVIRETEAEAVAYVVSKAVGLSLSSKSSDYIQLWSGDEKVLMQSLELIRKVSCDIIEAILDAQGGEKPPRDSIVDQGDSAHLGEEVGRTNEISSYTEGALL